MTRRKNKILPFLIALCVFIAAWWGCSSPTQMTGGSSGTEISIAGSVLDPAGKPVSGAIVRLRPSKFLVDSMASPSYVAHHSVRDTVTACNGSFAIDSIMPDTYSLEVMFHDSLSTLYGFQASTAGSPIQLRTDTLLPVAEVSGNLKVFDGDSSWGSVEIYGLQRSARPDSSGWFLIKIPKGAYTVHLGAHAPKSGVDAEFDGMNISVDVGYGVSKDMGAFNLYQAPPPGCLDGSCDSLVLRGILDTMGLAGVTVDSVCTRHNGRIVSLMLRGMHVKKVPSSITMLVNLRTLDLGYTGLSNFFPDIGNMTGLETLLLDGNYLMSLPESIGNLRALRAFDCSYNRLDNLPETIVNLQPSVRLGLSYNYLCSLDAAESVWADTFAPGWRVTQGCR